MMGFGGMGMSLPWVFGGITIAAIWIGLCPFLSTPVPRNAGGR
ncbi:MAG: hypothetical protein WAL91_09560 [Propionicimonas sp.]